MSQKSKGTKSGEQGDDGDLDKVLITKDLNQSGHMRSSIVRADNQPSIAIIFRYRERFRDTAEYVRYEIIRITFLPVRETIKHMKALMIPNEREN
jgi:hypothetical protein